MNGEALEPEWRAKTRVLLRYLPEGLVSNGHPGQWTDSVWVISTELEQTAVSAPFLENLQPATHSKQKTTFRLIPGVWRFYCFVSCWRGPCARRVTSTWKMVDVLYFGGKGCQIG